jgi:glutaconate CoA-transferase subunit B
MSDYTPAEMMTVAVARELRDDDVAFVGIGTGGRGFKLAVGIPTAACQLARLTHAPGLTLMLGPIINPDPSYQPPRYSDENLINWPCEAQIYSEEALDCFPLGAITVSFVSAAQVDVHGNLNVVAIGDHARPKVRLVGPIAQTDHLAAPARTVVMNELVPRTFVDEVDFISGAGYLTGGDARARAGLPEQGPWRVVTDRAVLGFDPETGRMRAERLFPGTSAADLQETMGREVPGASEAPTAAPPEKAELDVLRERIDPKRLLLRGEIE